MNVNFEYYKIFYYVAKYENFTKAANAIGSSQPNVTRAMNNLEQQLNCTLFVRSNRGIRLTPEGEMLKKRVSTAMAQLSEAEEELSDTTSLIKGSISIGVSETALNIFLLEKLKKFHKDFPGIRLKIYNHSTPQAIDSVKSGETDFAVVTTPAEVAPPLKTIMLMPFNEVLVGGLTFKALEKVLLTFEDLMNYPFICLSKETATYKYIHELFLKKGLEFNPDIEVATADLLFPMVKCELGLSFVPYLMTKDSIENKEIIPIQMKEKMPERQVCLVYDADRPLNAAAREFKAIL